MTPLRRHAAGWAPQLTAAQPLNDRLLKAEITKQGPRAAGHRAHVDNVHWTTYVASVQLDAAIHRVVGEPRSVTSDSATKLQASISRNGEKLAWMSLAGYAAGPRVEIRVRDRTSGRESVIGDSGFLLNKYPRMSRDGSLVAYLERFPEGIIAMVAPSDGGTPRRVGTNCQVADFYPGNRDILIFQGSQRLARQSLSGGNPVVMAESKSGFIWDPRLADDGKRIVFTRPRNDGSIAICIAPVEDRPVPENEWTMVVESRNLWLGEPNWSPDGKAIYHCSEDAWATSIQGRALDAVTGKPVGEPFIVLPRPAGNSASTDFMAGYRTPSGFSVARNSLCFIMAQSESNLWMLKLPR